jgi:hypothetical protein
MAVGDPAHRAPTMMASYFVKTSALTDSTQRGRAAASDGLPKFAMS